MSFYILYVGQKRNSSQQRQQCLGKGEGGEGRLQVFKRDGGLNPREVQLAVVGKLSDLSDLSKYLPHFSALYLLKEL